MPSCDENTPSGVTCKDEGDPDDCEPGFIDKGFGCEPEECPEGTTGIPPDCEPIQPDCNVEDPPPECEEQIVCDDGSTCTSGRTVSRTREDGPCDIEPLPADCETPPPETPNRSS